MKSGFLYTIFGVMLLSVSGAALAGKYAIIQEKELDHLLNMPSVMQSRSKEPKVLRISRRHEYRVIESNILAHCTKCACVGRAKLTVEKFSHVVPGIVVERAYNVYAKQQAGNKSACSAGRYYRIHDNQRLPLVFRRGPANAVIMAACVGLIALHQRDEVSLVAKNTANGIRKLIKKTSHNVNAFIQSKL